MFGEIEGVLFDLDGVLVNSIPSHGLAWTWIMKKTFGIEVDPFVAPLTEGLHSKKIARLIFEAAGYQEGLLIPEAELEEILNEKRAYYRSIVGAVSLQDPVVEVINTIKTWGKKTALVTSTSKKNLDHIVKDEQKKLFDKIFWAGSVTHSKPDPEPYLKAANSLNLPLHKCLVVENAVFGVRSARAAGCWCIALTSTLPADLLNDAHLILKSIEDLTDTQNWEKLIQIIQDQHYPDDFIPTEELSAPIPVRRLN